MKLRIGHGYDVHKFGEPGSAQSKPLILGGVTVPFEQCDQCLLAHSDGDVVLHAVCDAILGALALGDIGKHFPDTSSEWAGADSRDLLRHVFSLATERGFSLGNLDVTIIAQAPKMAPHITAMRQTLAEDLAAELDQINVKATTTEKLGFTGRKEGIATHTVVLLEQ